jgi:predicted PurR-regulated permease PerM
MEAPPLSPLVRASLSAGLAFFVIGTLYFAAPVLVPAAEAVVVWFVLNAVANGLRRLPFVGRNLSAGAALALAALVALAVGFVVVENSLRTAALLGPSTLGFREALDPLVAWVAATFGIAQEDLLNRAVDGLGLEAAMRQIVAGTIATISQFSIVAIYVAFLLVDQQFFDMKLRALVRDPDRQARTRALLDRIRRAVEAYLRVMTLVSGLTAILSYAVMRWLGLDYAGFWATTIFFLNFIPTIGSILGTVLPTAFALLQFQAVAPALAMLAGVGLVQFFVGNVLLPRMAGSTLNISLFVTLFSLFAWGALWGVTGMFVAMPITAIMIIVFSNFDATRPIAIILSRTGDFGDEANADR